MPNTYPQTCPFPTITPTELGLHSSLDWPHTCHLPKRHPDPLSRRKAEMWVGQFYIRDQTPSNYTSLASAV